MKGLGALLQSQNDCSEKITNLTRILFAEYDVLLESYIDIIKKDSLDTDKRCTQLLKFTEKVHKLACEFVVLHAAAKSQDLSFIESTQAKELRQNIWNMETKKRSLRGVSPAKVRSETLKIFSEMLAMLKYCWKMPDGTIYIGSSIRDVKSKHNLGDADINGLEKAVNHSEAEGFAHFSILHTLIELNAKLSTFKEHSLAYTQSWERKYMASSLLLEVMNVTLIGEINRKILDEVWGSDEDADAQTARFCQMQSTLAHHIKNPIIPEELNQTYSKDVQDFLFEDLEFLTPFPESQVVFANFVERYIGDQQNILTPPTMVAEGYVSEIIAPVHLLGRSGDMLALGAVCKFEAGIFSGRNAQINQDVCSHIYSFLGGQYSRNMVADKSRLEFYQQQSQAVEQKVEGWNRKLKFKPHLQALPRYFRHGLRGRKIYYKAMHVLLFLFPISVPLGCSMTYAHVFPYLMMGLIACMCLDKVLSQKSCQSFKDKLFDGYIGSEAKAMNVNYDNAPTIDGEYANIKLKLSEAPTANADLNADAFVIDIAQNDPALGKADSDMVNAVLTRYAR
jgi:hypothetical protein